MKNDPFVSRVQTIILKSWVMVFLIGSFTTLFPPAAQAETINECGNDVDESGVGLGFNGYYAPGNWTVLNAPGNGLVNFAAPASVTIVGSNGISGTNILTVIETTVVVDGTFSFNWSWSTADLPQFDPGFYQIGGTVFQLTNNAGGTTQSGSLSFTATAGTVIRFGVNSVDGCCGAATLTVSGFGWPASCPLNECGNYVDENDQGLDFFGYYNHANWTTNLNGGDGSVNNSSNQSVIIAGNNNSTSGIKTTYLATVPVGGTVSFSWSWTTVDSPGFDPGFVLIDGVQTNLTNSSSTSQSGTFSFAVTAGMVFGFGVDATDGCCGAAVLTIADLKWPGSCVPGCMDPTACNYSETATSDDGSCIPGGCMDPTALNYNPNVTCDNGTCVFGLPNDVCGGAEHLELVPGEVFSFVRSNSAASTDAGPGSCGIPEVITKDRWFSFTATGGFITIQGFGLFAAQFGPAFALFEECYSDPIACAAQTVGNVSFISLPCGTLIPGQTYYLQVGGGEALSVLTYRIEIMQTVNTEGCTNPTACNFNPDAACDDGTCEFVFAACNDPDACNYIPNCNPDPSVCLYPDCSGVCGGSAYIDECGNCVGASPVLHEKVFFYTGAEQSFTVPAHVNSIEIECYGAKGGEAVVIDFDALGFVSFMDETNIAGKGGKATGIRPVQPGQVLYVNVGGSGDNGGFNGGGTKGAFDSGSPCGNGGGASDVRLVSGDLNSRIIVAGGGGGARTIFEEGDVPFLAYFRGGDGGNDAGSTVLNATGGTQTSGGTGLTSGSFGLGATGANGRPGGGGGWYGGGSHEAGAGGSGFIGLMVNGSYLEGGNNTDGMIIFRWTEFEELPCSFGCTDILAVNFNAESTNDDGSCLYAGCTDPLATNYDSDATYDDNSCVYVTGCTYPDATNFNAAATLDDGTCTFELTSSCPADLNNDGLVGIVDLLTFVSAYGTVCP